MEENLQRRYWEIYWCHRHSYKRNRWKQAQTFAFRSSDISLVALALQVAFSEIKHTVLSSGQQPSSLQNNAKEMVIFSNLYSRLIFIVYFSPMEKSFFLPDNDKLIWEKDIHSTDQAGLEKLHICALYRWHSAATCIYHTLITNYQANNGATIVCAFSMWSQSYSMCFMLLSIGALKKKNIHHFIFQKQILVVSPELRQWLKSCWITFKKEKKKILLFITIC